MMPRRFSHKTTLSCNEIAVVVPRVCFVGLKISPIALQPTLKMHTR